MGIVTATLEHLLCVHEELGQMWARWTQPGPEAMLAGFSTHFLHARALRVKDRSPLPSCLPTSTFLILSSLGSEIKITFN